MSLPPSTLAVGLVLIAIVGLLVPRLLAQTIASLRITRGLRAKRRPERDDLPFAAAYHNALPESARADALDDATWLDLSMPDVFRTLDYTESQVGRQYLYHILRTPKTTAASLATLDQIVRRIDRDPAIAVRIREALASLDDPRAAHVVALLFDSLPERPRFWWIFPLLTLASIVCLGLVVFWPQAVLPWLGVCAVNVCVQLYYKPRVRAFVPAFHEMPTFLAVARRLAAVPLDECAEDLVALGAAEERLGVVRRTTRWLLFEPGHGNEFASTVYEYLNLLFLFDVNAYVFCTQAIRDSRAALRSMFVTIGYVDAAQSVAAWRRTLPHWTAPEFTSARKQIDAQQVFHPLLTAGVANSIHVAGTSVLITGSNMAGKTTFVRTIGVAAVLAQTVSTVCASTWRASLMRIRSAMARPDSLVHGKSHYLAEVESVLTLVRAKSETHQHLFLLDELFTGTNTTERIGAAYAVLAHLNTGSDVVFVATHDVELLDLLGEAFAPYHFREHVDGDVLTFDYLIQPGRSSTRNAIAVLRMMKYPEALVADALAVVDRTSAGIDS